MNNSIFIIFKILISSLLILTPSTTIVADGNPPPLYFNNLRQKGGMPSNQTNSIAQDKLGFIWIGTSKGVCRYDGYNTIVFNNNANPNSLPTNNISSLLMDGDTLWVGTWKGLCLINTKTLEIKRLNLGSTKAIRCLYKSKDNKIWIGTSEGLIVHNKKQNQYDYYDSGNSKISHSTIRCIYETSDNAIWIGTYDKLNKFQNGGFQSFDLKNDYKAFLNNNLILDICPVSDTNDTILLVGTETGLAKFNRFTEEVSLFNSSNTNISNEVVKCIYNEGGKIWLGTDFGLSITQNEFSSFDTYFHNPIINHSIANNVIWEIFKDRDGVLWLLTSNGISLIQQNNALFKLHEEFYSIGNQKAGNQIRDILADNNSIYLATNHGVIHKNLKTGLKEYFNIDAKEDKQLLLDNVHTLCKDKADRIWIGTAGGINIWDAQNKRIHAISANKENGLTSNYISSLAITQDGTIWASAWEGGIFKLDGNIDSDMSVKFIKADNQTPSRIYACGDNIYYTISNKLWEIDHQTLSTSLVKEVNKKLNNQPVFCMNSSYNGTIWLASENKVINYQPENKTINTFLLNTTIVDEPINLEIDDNNIWITTLSTVMKFDISSGETISMPLNPNYPLNNFYGQCSAVSDKGVVYFGGDNGYVETKTTNNTTKLATPFSIISGISINNKPFSSIKNTYLPKIDAAYLEKLELKHPVNSITFYLSGLNFWLSDKNKFKHRLRNYDKGWKNSKNVNFISYSNLKPGNYVLEFETFNYLGAKSPTTKTLQIKIHPPIWLSKAFIALYIISILGLLFLSIKIFLKRRKLNNQLRLANLEKKHSQEILETKQRFFTNISHEFRTPLSLITPPIQHILKSGELKGKNLDMLILAEKNSNRLLKLVNQILDFRKIEKSRITLNQNNVDIVKFCKEVFDSFKDMAALNEVDYSFSCNTPNFLTCVDKEKIEAILFNLLSNAFKHTPSEGSIQLIIEAPLSNNQNNLSISIKDTGSGISPDEIDKIFERFYQVEKQSEQKQGTGIGLAMAKHYATLHNGRINVTSQLQKGSTFTLLLPVVKSLSDAEEIAPDTTIRVNEKRILSEIKNEPAKKVLVVDDNIDILNYVEMNLDSDYKIYKATNGNQGLEMAQKYKPNIIVSDIMMPVMDGIEMCRKLKREITIERIPIILLTAKSLNTQKTEGINTGADMYITKPFDIDYLNACIKNLLKKEEQLNDYIRKQLLIAPSGKNDTEKNQDEQFMKKVMDIISKNIDNPRLSVEMISADIGISSTHLYRKVKAITNQSTKDILKNYRLQKAAQMIRNNEGNVSEIMYSVGFNSLSSFSKSFKSKFGFSPSDYR